MPLGMQVDHGPHNIVLHWDPIPSPRKKGEHTNPNYLTCSSCGQMAAQIKMPRGTEIGLGPLHVVLDGDSASSQKGQRAGWIKMPLGVEVGFGPGNIVLDGDPASPKRGTQLLQFSAHVCCVQMVTHLSYC